MRNVPKRFVILLGLFLMLVLSGCGTAVENERSRGSEKLRVVATTTFIGDTVARIAEDAVELTVLLAPGQNPHSYQLTPQDMVKVSEADLVFANGLDLEEFLDDLMTGSENQDALVIVSRDINPREGEEDHAEDHDAEDHAEEDHDGEDHAEDHDADDHEGEDHGAEDHEAEDHAEEDHGHDHGGLDPHVWFDPNNIISWVGVISEALADVDPGNAVLYQENAQAYRAELDALDRWIRDRVASIPVDNRKLVTDHETFGYFADQYGFEIIGAVIPSQTTEVETSGQEMAALIDTIQDHAVPAIFVGIDIDAALAELVAEESGVDLIPLYSGSLSEGDPAGTYLDFMRYNVDQIVAGLK